MLLGSNQRVALAYLPQSNGQQVRLVQTLIRGVRAYVAEADQSDWDEPAERLMYALNIPFNETLLDTPYYLVRGWGPQETVLAMLGPKALASLKELSMSGAGSFSEITATPRRAPRTYRRRPSVRSDSQNRKWREFLEQLKGRI